MIIVNDTIIRIFEKLFKIEILAMALYPFIVVKSTTIIDNNLINHEKIHLKQQIEMLIIPFYIWYLIAYKFKGYENISFEKEARQNERNLNYLKNRKPFSFIKYLK